MWQTMWCHPQASENGMGQGTDHALPQHPQLHLSVCGGQRGSRWSCGKPSMCPLWHAGGSVPGCHKKCCKLLGNNLLEVL